MKLRPLLLVASSLAVLLGGGSAHLGAQTPQAVATPLPVLTPDEYGRFELLNFSNSLSPDGTWVAYRVSRVDGDTELRVRAVSGGEERVVPWGTDPRFSDDSRWLTWGVGASQEERDAAEEAGSPLRDGAGLLDLTSGEERSFDAVRARSFDSSGRFLALHGYPPDEPRGRGATLRVLDLGEGGETTLGPVGEFAWSEEGSWLAFTVATGEEEGAAPNGLQVLAPANGRLLSLDATSSSYRSPRWSTVGTDLAVLRSTTPAGADSTAHEVLAWRGVGDTDAPTRRVPQVLSFPQSGHPDTLQVVGHRAPEWSEDGRWVMVGLRPTPSVAAEDAEDEEAGPGGREDEEEGEADPDEEGEAEAEKAGREDSTDLPAVQLWHTRDVRIVPMQQVQASRDAARTLLAVWDPDGGEVRQVGQDLLAEAMVSRDGTWGLEKSWASYPWGFMFGRPYHDVRVVDLGTGDSRLALERVRYSWEDPSGRYLLTFDGEHYHSVELGTGVRRALTRGLPGVFSNQEYDTPTDLLPPYGFGGWLDDGEHFLVYDRYDVWRVALDGTGGERITQGAEEEVIHRVVRLDSDAPDLPSNGDLYLTLRGEWTEQRGYARLSPEGSVERLILKDRLVSQLLKADSAEVYLFREESRLHPPNLFAAGSDLAAPQRVTDINSFQGEYAWPQVELVDFESEAGERLQGVLLYPVNYDPGRPHPLIVYTYERLSQQLHSYQPPSERSYYNFTAWTMHGYFVLLPDIVYRARDPGVSALEAVRPAVASVVERGLVDPDRVGLIGHSWGGYQATYLPTRTDIFAASVAGAPLTDFVSFMGQIHWNAGSPEADHWETGQGRMEVPYWEDPEAHHRNSPLHAMEELNTPLLMAFGDEDGVVEPWQGTLFYNYARRAEKQMVLLFYEGEDHGFQNKANQVDYHRRILEWFGHYLKGEEAPEWIEQGIPLNRMDQEKRRVAQPPG